MNGVDGLPLKINGQPAEFDPDFQAAVLAFDWGLMWKVEQWRTAAYISETVRLAERAGG